MSRKVKAELLICGYIKKNHITLIPMDISNLIQHFYDKHFYWQIQQNQMTQLVTAKNWHAIKSKSIIKIKGIEFQCLLYPNRWGEESEGSLLFAITIAKIPSDVEHFIVSTTRGCETTSVNLTSVRKRWNEGQRQGGLLMKSSDYHDKAKLDFYCIIDILAIKYRENSDFQDYKMEFKMHKHIEYEWKINDKQTMKAIKGSKRICSDNFDNNNWCAVIYEGEPENEFWIGIFLLRFPWGISSFNATYSIRMEFASGKIYVCHEQQCELQWVEVEEWNASKAPFRGYMTFQCKDVDRDELIHQEWIKIYVTIDITEMFVDEKSIDEGKWNDYGFV